MLALICPSFLLLLKSNTFPPYVSSPQLAEGNQWRCRSDPSPPPGHGAPPASQSPPSAGTCQSHPAWHCRAVAAGPLALGGRRRSSGWETFIKRESRDWHRKVEVFIRGWKWKRKERWRCGKVLMQLNVDISLSSFAFHNAGVHPTASTDYKILTKTKKAATCLSVCF